ncbi:hypothetical protein GALL_267950 [mine drainage metagenome]|uniref:Uncharacterized protein n=1 Tax=mine drainage metagenome TaxID=410659 RepID=A0A1J5R5R3_9ZZZZ
MPGLLRGARHAHDATSRPRQNGVLAAKRMRLGQPAAGLHEQQAHPRHLGRDLLNIAPQDGREIGVHHRGVAARDEFHQRTGFVRGAHLREADAARDARRRPLVRRVAPAMHEHDGHGAQAGVERRLELPAQDRLVQRPHHLAVRADALVGLDHALVEQFRQHDAAVEQARAVLVGDAQGIPKTLCGHQRHGFALTLQQGVRRHRGAHLHGLDQGRRDPLSGPQPEQMTDASHRGIAVLLRVLRQQLVRQ